ncbi:hypothetical protein Aspvir_005187 [Aspergillus viridinutans]|uniref:Peptidase M20 dimerisation domain-containing protein n=1 Tax=Aspergillus viridinutans TaxID=75553 RepID=A0A9P3BRU8_ASPVI|nr:uncharacterized protein Aspvir_005187 [Aspergillus viridinutans]GIK01155.1 hypothetical protein Aspvir_005187 [Aspergillus viridinutans]
MRWFAHVVPAVVGFGIPSAMSLSIPSPQLILKSWSGTNNICPLAPKVEVPEDGLLSALRYVQDEAIRLQQVDRLSRAVQIPTTVNDYMKDPFDEWFAPFVDFQELLESLFPLIHSYAYVDHINRLGLLYTLNGTDDSLKPILFMAHQDVVPINDPSDWTYPPFAGHFDGEWLWGRGASDCKNVLIGLLSVIEDLLQQNWQPTRTIVLAFGFDEESHGFLGAGSLAPALEEKYGPDSFEFILDEGGMGLETLGDDVVYALPGVGEKGSIDIVLSLDIAGGHSSIPPPHTGIGIMAEIIYELERQDLFVPILTDDHPSRRMLECQARYSPNHVEPWLASGLQSSDHVALAEKLASSRGDAFRYILQTSQAADIFNGGIKSNALPEKISALVNYRIALHQTPELIKQRAIDIIAPIADKHNLSPTNIDTDAVWARFAGVARTSFESVPSLKGKTVVVSGDIMTGNTDTRFYWALSRNIYRWSPSRRGGSLNIHTVDERVAIDVHLEAMVLYYNLIRSFDAWNDSVGASHDL